MPDVREVSNILLANGVNVLLAGRSRDIARTLIGAVMFVWQLIKRLTTGRLNANGLWFIPGFEDHVFRQRQRAAALDEDYCIDQILATSLHKAGG